MDQQVSQQTKDLMKELLNFSQGWQDGIQQRLEAVRESLEKSEVKEEKFLNKEKHPLITSLELCSISGASLKVLEYAPERIVSWDKDVGASALYITEEHNVCVVPLGNKVTPSVFKIIGRGKTEEEQIKDILVQEDNLFIQLLKAAACAVNTIIPFTNFYGKNLLDDVMQQVERHAYLADKFIINRNTLGVIKKTINSIDYDPVFSKDLREGKLFASIWGVNIFVFDSILDEAEVIFSVTAETQLGKRTIQPPRSVGGELWLEGTMCIPNAKMVACGAYHKLLDIKFK